MMDYGYEYDLGQVGFEIPGIDDVKAAACKLMGDAYLNGECVEPAIAQAACYAQTPPGTWVADELKCRTAAPPTSPPRTIPPLPAPPRTIPPLPAPPSQKQSCPECATKAGVPIWATAAVAAGAAFLAYNMRK